MPIKTVSASHCRVVCDACGSEGELCGKREDAIAAKVRAVASFQRAGWKHDPVTARSSRAVESSERLGMGRWYCPTCARKTHL